MRCYLGDSFNVDYMSQNAIDGITGNWAEVGNGLNTNNDNMTPGGITIDPQLFPEDVFFDQAVVIAGLPGQPYTGSTYPWLEKYIMRGQWFDIRMTFSCSGVQVGDYSPDLRLEFYKGENGELLRSIMYKSIDWYTGTDIIIARGRITRTLWEYDQPYDPEDYGFENIRKLNLGISVRNRDPEGSCKFHIRQIWIDLADYGYPKNIPPTSHVINGIPEEFYDIYDCRGRDDSDDYTRMMHQEVENAIVWSDFIERPSNSYPWLKVTAYVRFYIYDIDGDNRIVIRFKNYEGTILAETSYPEEYQTTNNDYEIELNVTDHTDVTDWDKLSFMTIEMGIDLDGQSAWNHTRIYEVALEIFASIIKPLDIPLLPLSPVSSITSSSLIPGLTIVSPSLINIISLLQNISIYQIVFLQILNDSLSVFNTSLEIGIGTAQCQPAELNISTSDITFIRGGVTIDIERLDNTVTSRDFVVIPGEALIPVIELSTDIEIPIINLMLVTRLSVINGDLVIESTNIEPGIYTVIADILNIDANNINSSIYNDLEIIHLELLNTHLRNFKINVEDDITGLTFKYGFTKTLIQNIMSKKEIYSVSKERKNVDFTNEKIDTFFRLKEDLLG